MRLAPFVVLGACSFHHGSVTAHDDATGPPDVLADSEAVIDVNVDANLTGIIARWEFDAPGDQGVVFDSMPNPLNLTIDTPTNVQFSAGAMTITAATTLRSAGPATKIIDRCRATGRVSIEAWVTPANDLQAGPARIVSISVDITNRNITLGQDGATYHFRLRTPNTGLNGVPVLMTGSVIPPSPTMQQVVVVHEGTQRRLYVDGVERGADLLGGSFAGWDTTYPLLMGDEAGVDRRTWLGTYHRVTVYDRALSLAEIQALKLQGP